jgi:hypothetical protein
VTLTVDGLACSFERSGDDVTFAIDLRAGATAEVRIEQPRRDDPDWKSSSLHRAAVRARRILGEFRDDYVDTTRSRVDRLIRTPFGRRTRKPLMNGAAATK